MRIANDSTQAQIAANWAAPIGSEGRLEVKIGATDSRRTSAGELQAFDENHAELLFRTVDSLLKDRNLTFAGKYSVSLAVNHTLSSGWDAQHGVRAESRLQHETSVAGYPTLDLNDDYNAAVSRLAVYAQNEWSIAPRLSAYFGVRWEGLETKTEGNVLASVENRSSVFSPTMQILWKIPETKSDQLRVNLARSYKAPTARDLIPRRWVVNDNSATSPNFQGNPGLVPELAWGFDVGYERYLTGADFLGVNLYARHIENVIQERVFNDGGTWVSTPSNGGTARVFGLELEGRGKVKSLFGYALDVDLRGGLTRNWSKVKDVPGPGNRIKGQPQFTASIGMDYRRAGTGLTLGGTFSFEDAGFVRTSPAQSTAKNIRRTLDLYGLWSINKRTKLRLTLANLLRSETITKSTYVDSFLAQEQTLVSPSFRIIRVLFETRL